MEIVQLDSYAANPGDISWHEWENLSHNGEKITFTRYPRTAPEETVERAKDACMVLTNKVLITDEVMEQLPQLRYIGVLATGYNVVDVEAAHRRGIIVTNIPAYSTMSVAQHVFAHILNITNRVQQHSEAVSAGRWQHSPDFTFWDFPLIELDRMTIGIIGMGNTGTATARIALAMGMKVLAYSSKGEATLRQLISGNAEDTRIMKAESLAALFSTADIVSLHCPLTPDTKHIINSDSLRLMKKTAILINTGRGPLIDEEALAKALTDGDIYAAGIDVLTTEPPVDGSPLTALPNCFITPHTAWATRAARERLLHIALDNIRAFLNGTPQNQVMGGWKVES